MHRLLIKKTQNNTAWVFPGQSSQEIGMGLDLQAYPFARARLEQAQKILGWSVTEACQNKDKLSSTLYTQPCLYVIETLLADLMGKEGYKPTLVAGYSMGEYAAIYTAGALDFVTGLQIIKRRAELMQQSPKGKMVALIGCNQEQLAEKIIQTPNVWQMNDDLNVAIVSGSIQGVNSLIDKVNVRRVIPLNVSCAFHTPLMLKAAAEFQEILDSVVFEPIKIPVLSSIDLIPTLDITQVKNNLIRQIYYPVKWRAISLYLPSQGIKEVVEIGPGQDLVKQMKRNCPELTYRNVNSLNTLKNQTHNSKSESRHLLRHLPGVVITSGFCNF